MAILSILSANINKQEIPSFIMNSSEYNDTCGVIFLQEITIDELENHFKFIKTRSANYSYILRNNSKYRGIYTPIVSINGKGEIRTQQYGCCVIWDTTVFRFKGFHISNKYNNALVKDKTSDVTMGIRFTPVVSLTHNETGKMFAVQSIHSPVPSNGTKRSDFIIRESIGYLGWLKSKKMTDYVIMGGDFNRTSKNFPSYNQRIARRALFDDGIITNFNPENGFSGHIDHILFGGPEDKDYQSGIGYIQNILDVKTSNHEMNFFHNYEKNDHHPIVADYEF